MDYQTKSNLVNALSDAFTGDKDLQIETSNYIETTGTMDCNALGLDLNTLQKTRNVIEQHENKFRKQTNNPMSAQYMMHLKVAKKCVDEIMSQIRNGGK